MTRLEHHLTSTSYVNYHLRHLFCKIPVTVEWFHNLWKTKLDLTLIHTVTHFRTNTIVTSWNNLFIFIVKLSVMKLVTFLNLYVLICWILCFLTWNLGNYLSFTLKISLFKAFFFFKLHHHCIYTLEVQHWHHRILPEPNLQIMFKKRLY